MHIKAKHWNIILKVKSLFPSLDLKSEGIVIERDAVSIVSLEPVLKEKSVFIFNDQGNFKVKSSKGRRKKLVKALEFYLPFFWVDKDCDYPRLCLHVAQSLDGKIATNFGSSKWIGNMENRIHSHRIRALVDAVIIGGNTIRNDKPKLNVRHVKGQDPVKVVISSKNNDYSSLKTSPDSKIICFGKHNQDQDGAKSINIEKNEDGVLCTESILTSLKSQGIQSALLEGGKETIHHFLAKDQIDLVEFHIAPILMGSGIQAIEMKEIKEISEALALTKPEYVPFGDAILFRSHLQKSKS